MLNEDCIIKTLSFYSNGYIGDDAAVLPCPGNNQYVISKDLLIEDVHFRTRYVTPEDLAHKALQVNLSDLAAMGATPQFILCGISIPARLQAYASSFLEHMPLKCRDAGVLLIGGDTTSASDKISISITAIGGVQPGSVMKRDSASVSDVLYVAGNLGFAHLGFLGCESNDETCFKSYFLRPNARTKEGAWLASQSGVTSMMDVSDGLYVDLGRLCEASACAAVVNLDQLETNAEYKEECKRLSLDPAVISLSGGEDYSLLFTVNKYDAESIEKYFLELFSYPLKPVGYTTNGQGISFAQKENTLPMSLPVFNHFGSSNDI